ncbi:MAG: citrate synthase/methylcitrate synthase [Chloroflexota bacterium]|nr:citrate synthase/methylcitrate synthase [Chloroflexota bacterium]
MPFEIHDTALVAVLTVLSWGSGRRLKGVTAMSTQEVPAQSKAIVDAAGSGLEGVVVARTDLSDVDGLAGRLTIRGYDLEDLAGNATFEEVVYLLWNGSLPTQSEHDALHEKLAGFRQLPEETRVAVELAARRMGPMDALRFAVASLTADDDDADDESREANLERAAKLAARVPVIVADYQRLRTGQQSIPPRAELRTAANFLWQLTGVEPPAPEVRGLDTYWTTVSDHGMNASTFTARVIASTASDMVSAVTGAIGALKGSRHGGAPGPALEMIRAIGTPENAEPWMRAAVARGERLMGFGHRVYKVRDPRAEVLSQAAEALADETGEQKALALAREVERAGVKVLAEVKPGRHLNTNVEFYTALLLSEIGLPPDLFSPAFAIGRMAGWTAHILENQEAGRLIRPSSEYTGPRDQRYAAISER